MRLCSVPGCTNKHHAKGYCQKHYYQSKSHRYAIPDNRTRDTRHMFSDFSSNKSSNKNHINVSAILDHCLLELKNMTERLDKLK